MKALLKRITVNESVCNGKPTIRGLRISVKTILEFLFAGEKRDEILRQYRDLEPEDIEACIAFALLTADQQFSIHELAA